MMRIRVKIVKITSILAKILGKQEKSTFFEKAIYSLKKSIDNLAYNF